MQMEHLRVPEEHPSIPEGFRGIPEEHRSILIEHPSAPGRHPIAQGLHRTSPASGPSVASTPARGPNPAGCAEYSVCMGGRAQRGDAPGRTNISARSRRRLVARAASVRPPAPARPRIPLAHPGHWLGSPHFTKTSSLK